MHTIKGSLSGISWKSRMDIKALLWHMDKAGV